MSDDILYGLAGIQYDMLVFKDHVHIQYRFNSSRETIIYYENLVSIQIISRRGSCNDIKFVYKINSASGKAMEFQFQYSTDYRQNRILAENIVQDIEKKRNPLSPKTFSSLIVPESSGTSAFRSVFPIHIVNRERPTTNNTVNKDICQEIINSRKKASKSPVKHKGISKASVTSLGPQRITVALPDNRDWYANFKQTDDGIKMTYFNCGQLATKKDLADLFRRAYAYWKIPLLKPNKQSSYTGVVLGPEYARSAFLRELKSRNVELQENWDKEEQIFIIGKQLDNIDWDRLIPYWNQARLFTPQGFLNFLAGNVKDNENDADVNRLLSECKYCAEGYFEWPLTDVYPSQGILSDFDAPESGVLKLCGYHVGQTGIPEYERHQILRMVFTGKLPFVGDSEHMQKWNTARTPYRLQKMANTIASLTKNRKKERNGSEKYRYAISDWEVDLAWLKKEYYDKMSFQFQWPSTYAR